MPRAIGSHGAERGDNYNSDTDRREEFDRSCHQPSTPSANFNEQRNKCKKDGDNVWSYLKRLKASAPTVQNLLATKAWRSPEIRASRRAPFVTTVSQR